MDTKVAVKSAKILFCPRSFKASADFPEPAGPDSSVLGNASPYA